MSILMSNAVYAVCFIALCLATGFFVIWLAARVTATGTTPHSLMQPRKTRISAPPHTDPIVVDAPYPIWQSDSQNKVVFANKAYLAHAAKVHPGPSRGRIPDIFPVRDQTHDARGPVRASTLDLETEATHWFDIIRVDTVNGTIHYATDANATVKAEVAQRNFVQTLTKTFAQLSIGLAIFDRNRQLALFNPALIDLTALSAEFLSARPNLQSFFDRMRETRMIPEPKDYASWRKQIADVVVAAADGRYCETWSLPSGMTYRVTGRPHPDGAVAFLFEDISAEVSLTRHFRAELELGHSVLDTLDDAICVFSPTGVLTLSNQAYHALWGVNPDLSFAEITVRDAVQHWQDKYPHPELWDRIQKFVMNYGVRQLWQQRIATSDDVNLVVGVSPIAGGATLLTFTSRPTAAARRKLPAARNHPAPDQKKLDA